MLPVPPLKLMPLQSGSSGNAIYVEGQGVGLLFDSGLSASTVEDRLAAHGIDAAKLAGLFVSHEHADHIKGVGACARKFGAPLHITQKTLDRARRRMALGNLPDVRIFRSGMSITVGPLTVETIPTPHDAVDGSVFVVDDGWQRVGICTDVGHVYRDLGELVSNVDALYLESNYDDEMLRTGSYPASLKRRISGPGGHISNRDAARLVARRASSSRLQWLYLAHLSAENNRPELAMKAHRAELGADLPIVVAPRYTAGPMLEIGGARRVIHAFAKPEPERTALERLMGL